MDPYGLAVLLNDYELLVNGEAWLRLIQHPVWSAVTGYRNDLQNPLSGPTICGQTTMWSPENEARLNKSSAYSD